MWRVLCVEDKPAIAENLKDYFEQWDDGNPYGHLNVTIESSFDSAIELVKRENFDLITLDLHGAGDPDPMQGDGDAENQEGARVLNELRKTRFVPVIFYTGFAERIAGLATGVVHVVKKGENDLDSLRKAAREIYETGLPTLARSIQDDTRDFMWDTVDKHWNKVKDEPSARSNLAYLLARRLAARLSRESIKHMLSDKVGIAKPIEKYIYPAIQSDIMTGWIIKEEDESHWIVATPACDFAQKKADQVLLIGTQPLTADVRHVAWSAGSKWKGSDSPPSRADEKKWDALFKLLRNNAGDRWRFFPGTFFLPALVADLQKLKQVSRTELEAKLPICQIDSPDCEALLLHLSRYYGRIGTPDLDVKEIVDRL
jgi:CheY-like chemotaxis protein